MTLHSNTASSAVETAIATYFSRVSIRGIGCSYIIILHMRVRTYSSPFNARRGFAWCDVFLCLDGLEPEHIRILGLCLDSRLDHDLPFVVPLDADFGRLTDGLTVRLEARAVTRRIRLLRSYQLPPQQSPSLPVQRQYMLRTSAFPKRHLPPVPLSQ